MLRSPKSSNLFRFTTKIVYVLLISSMHATCLMKFPWFDPAYNIRWRVWFTRLLFTYSIFSIWNIFTKVSKHYLLSCLWCKHVRNPQIQRRSLYFPCCCMVSTIMSIQLNIGHMVWFQFSRMLGRVVREFTNVSEELTASTTMVEAVRTSELLVYF
jgi:hypothetical protein